MKIGIALLSNGARLICAGLDQTFGYVQDRMKSGKRRAACFNMQTLWSLRSFLTQMIHDPVLGGEGGWISPWSFSCAVCWRANNLQHLIPDISPHWCSLEGSVSTSTWRDGSGLRSLSVTAESYSQGGHEFFAEGLFTLHSSNPIAKPQSKPCSEEIILALSIEPRRVFMSSLSPVSDGAAGVSINYLIAVFEKCP